MKQIRKRKVEKGLLLLILVFLFTNFCLLHLSMASSNISSANLYSKGECGDLLKKDGSIIKVTYVVYSKDGKEYPAYCLDKEKPGVGESGDYSVSVDQVLSDVAVWKTITNGYPYQSVSDLGCSSAQEAFTATKMAVYATLYGYSIDRFTGIGEAGERTLRALDQILTKASQAQAGKISSDLTIKQESEDWGIDTVDTRYISKTFQVTAKSSMQPYNLSLNGTMTEDTKVTNLQNQPQQEFGAGEKFKVLLPIQQLGNGGEIEVKAKSAVQTKPIFLGRAPSSNLQDYAITAGSYEDGEGFAKVPYTKNETKIKVLKQDKETNEPLSGAVFDLYDANQKLLKSNLVSNEKGEILLNDVLPGVYYLKETKAPNSYNLYEDFILLDIAYNEEITVIVHNAKEDEKTTVEVKKSKKQVTPQALKEEKLPQTGY